MTVKLPPNARRSSNRKIRALYWREYRRNHSEATRSASRRSYRLHLAKRKSEKREYYSKNRVKILKKGAAYRRKNLLKIKLRQKAYHASRYRTDPAYRSKLITQSKRWGLAHPQKRRDAVRKYALKNPHVFLAKHHAYRASKKKATVDPAGISEYVKTVRNAPVIHCFYCVWPVPKRKRHIDHKIPLSRGGEHTLENLCCACEHCNCVKGDKTVLEYRMLAPN